MTPEQSKKCALTHHAIACRSLANIAARNVKRWPIHLTSIVRCGHPELLRPNPLKLAWAIEEREKHENFPDISNYISRRWQWEHSWGCSSGPAKSPDVSGSIRRSLDQQPGLKDVSVSQDRDKRRGDSRRARGV